MKKKTILIGLSIIGILSSCGNGTSSTITSSVPTLSTGGGTSSVIEVTADKTNKDFEKARTTYLDSFGKEQDLTMQTLYTNQGSPHLDPLKEAHVMVVPFGFTDYAEQQTQEKIDDINSTFFGDDNGWYSVASYYRTSSYGKSNFQGKVLPNWCVYKGTSAEFYNENKGILGVKAAEYARNWYISEYEKDDHGLLGADAEDISYFDADNDGYIDLLWVVYSRPTGTVNDWWAYVTYTGNRPNSINPTVQTLGFASTDWMNKGFNGHDPHTYIHETGHTYGLDDYYDYTNSWAPMGKIDMMDNNLGDHCAFSKFTLGWLAPLVVDDTAEITLYPTTTTGDCFLIPSPNYNGTAFDEYILVEFMAPVGIAEYDYKNGYENISGYSKPGVRISHVDARVYEGGKHDTYLADNPQNGIDFRVCNTKGGRSGIKADGDYFLREDGTKSYYSLSSLIESGYSIDDNVLSSSTHAASHSSLWVKGDKLVFNDQKGGWADIFMPSGTNLWNKAKTTTGWNGSEQTQAVDDTMTIDFEITVKAIERDAEHGYKATILVEKTTD